jgi:hypothetical protein
LDINDFQGSCFAVVVSYQCLKWTVAQHEIAIIYKGQEIGVEGWTLLQFTVLESKKSYVICYDVMSLISASSSYSIFEMI